MGAQARGEQDALTGAGVDYAPIMLLWLLLIASPLWADAPVDPVRTALAEQVDLPAWEQRRASANARVDAANRALRGERSLEAGFPRLADGAWGSASWVAGQLALLDQFGAECAAERVVPAPPLGRETARWERAREAALTTEDTADALERRFLLGLRAFHTAHPQLTDAGLAPWLADLEDRRSAVEADWEEDGSGALALAHVDEERSLLLGLQRAAMASAVVPDVPLGIERDIERLLDPDLAPDAAVRLALGWSVTGTTAADAWLAQDTPSVPADADALQAALDRNAARRARLSGPPAALEWLDRHDQALLEALDALQAQAALEAEEAQDLAPALDLDEADAARLAAEQALADATGAREISIAEVVKATYDQVQHATKIRGQVESEATTFDEREGAFRVRLSQLQADHAAVQVLPPLDATREPKAVAAWRASNDLVSELREVASVRHEITAEDWALQRQDELDTARSALEADRGRVDATSVRAAEALERREQTLEAEAFDIDRRVDRAKEHVTAILALLSEAKALRRALKDDVPRSVWLAEEKLVEEGLTEVRLLLPSVWALTRHRVAELLAWPTVSSAFAMLRGLMGAGVVALLWWAMRSRSGLLVAAVVSRWSTGASKREQQRRLAELSRLIEPATPVVAAVFDLLGVWILTQLLGERAPELGFLLLIYGQIASYRLVRGVYRLLVAPWAEQRPALRYLDAEAWQLGDRTVRWLAMWAIARQFVGRVLLDLLGVDALNELAMRAFAILLVGVVARLLHLWEPTVRARIARAGTDNAVRAYLSKPPGQALLTSWFRALVGVLLVSLGSGWTFVQGQAGEKGTLGRLLNLFYRYSLGDKDDDADTDPVPLPPDLLAKIFDEHVQAAWRIERHDADQAFWAAIRRWQREKRFGTLALTADTGAGCNTWLQAQSDKVASEGLGLLRFSIDHRITDESQLCRWLARSLGCAPCDETSQIVAELVKHPPSVIVVDRGHMAFLRRVGGFDALQTLLDVLGHTSDRHFWVVVFHAPAWAYLSRLHRLVKVHLFRDIVRIGGLNEADLAKLTRARTEAAGYTLDFGRLVKRGALSGDAEGELERATRAFYRVLGEASLGNPMVALQLWSESLSTSSEDVLQVRLGRAVRETRAEGLSETELFTLAALRVHECLTPVELARVNNMPSPTVRASLQVLAGRGLIGRGNLDDWQITDRELATVTRTLVQRNLMEWRA